MNSHSHSHTLTLTLTFHWNYLNSQVNPLILQGMSTSAILTWGSLSYTRVFTSFSPMQFSFFHPAPCCLKSKCICPHLCTQVCWSKKEVCSGALLACYYFEELKIACTIDQLKPSLKSMAQYYNTFLLFRERVSRKCTSGWDHTTHVHFAYYTQGCAEAHKYAKKIKNYSVKEYNWVGYININISYMSLWIVNEATYLLAHETCSVCAP